MSSTTFVPAVLVLGISLIPVWLLRRTALAREATRPAVVANASIAHALRLVVIGPLFAWGASGEWWPAVIVALSLALGAVLIQVLQKPLVAFIDDALRANQSFTVDAFIARRHGDDPRVRLLAASLTLIALFGLLVAEALAVVLFLESLLPGQGTLPWLLVSGVLLLAALHAVPAGHAGVMQSAQWQLGMLYLGLFGSMALLLYVHVSARTPLPPHGTLAIVLAAAWCAFLLYWRRSRYVDTVSSSRLLARLAKTLNALLSVLLGLILVVALMDLYATGAGAALRDSLAALGPQTRVPAIALFAVGLLAALYPLVDVANWQRLAALRTKAEPAFALVSAVTRRWAVETVLALLFVWFLGALVAAASGTDSLHGVLAQVGSEESESAVVLPLLVIVVLAAAMSAMGALCSAALTVAGCDRRPSTGVQAPGRGLVVGAALLTATLIAFRFLGAALSPAETGNALVVLLIASCCLQLSFTPLVIGEARRLRPAWALAAIVAGVVAGVVPVILYLSTGAEALLWSAVPFCVGSTWLVATIGRAARPSRRT